MKPLSRKQISESLKRLRKVGDAFKVGTDRERKNAIDAATLLKRWGQLDGLTITSRQNEDTTYTIFVAP